MAGRNRTFLSLLALTVIAALTASLFFSTVVGEVATSYGGTTAVYDPPSVTFSVGNGSVLYNSGNLTLGLTASIGEPLSLGSPHNSLQTLLVALTSVSYKASWQVQPVTLYTWRINNPANLSEDDPNPQQSFSYSLNLTGMPEVFQQVEVTVFGGGAVWASSGQKQVTYYVFSTNSSSTLNFTAEVPPSGPFPTVTAIAAVSIVALVVVVSGLLIHRKRRMRS